MFSNLDEQIESAEGTSPTLTERIIRYLEVTVLSLVVFAGLLLGLWLLEY